MLFLRGLKLRLPCVGVVGIFDLQFVAGIVEVVKKKQRDSKFLACTLGTCKSSHYKKTSRCLWNLMLYFQQEIKFLFEIWRNTVHTVFYQTSLQLSCPCLSWVSQFVFWVYWDDFLSFLDNFWGFFGHFKTVLIQQVLGSK